MDIASIKDMVNIPFSVVENHIKISILKNVLHDVLSRQIVKKFEFKTYTKILEKVIKKKDSELDKKYTNILKKKKLQN